MARNIRLDDEREHVRKAREKEERRREYESKWVKQREDPYNRPSFKWRLEQAGSILTKERHGYGDHIRVVYQTADSQYFNDEGRAKERAGYLMIQMAEIELAHRGIEADGSLRRVGPWEARTFSSSRRTLYYDGVELEQVLPHEGSAYIENVTLVSGKRIDDHEYVERYAADGTIERYRIR